MQNKVKIIDGNSKNCKWDEDYKSIDYLSEEQWVSQQKEAVMAGEAEGIGSESASASAKEGGTTTR